MKAGHRRESNMYKRARGFRGSRPSALQSPTKRGFGRGPFIDSIGAKPSGKPKRPKRKIKLKPFKTRFDDPRKTAKADEISSRHNRRMAAFGQKIETAEKTGICASLI
jgi:hypothetical protein